MAGFFLQERQKNKHSACEIAKNPVKYKVKNVLSFIEETVRLLYAADKNTGIIGGLYERNKFV